MREGSAGDPGRRDKLSYLLFYAVVAITVGYVRPRRFIWIIAVLALWGRAIQLLQPIAGPSAGRYDFLTNLAGLGLGMAIGFGAAPVARSIRR